MLKLSKMSDYGAVVMAQMARHPEQSHAAAELADSVGLPRPTVSKTLKLLLRAGLLASHRGARGGYRLARPAHLITVRDIITAIEGPIAMTECGHVDGDCELMASCGVVDNWQRVSLAVRQLLDSVTLSDLAHDAPIRLPLTLPIQSVAHTRDRDQASVEQTHQS
ncbi:SUF system Fe-S cluster assembly regulator [Kushneria phosphatilytica]|uniref:SUF system Fe-S cluster assembly regulator n=1 Tax=Kushneria phosphatilytica TaxID=657387 RepID=A0A1S1NPK4_9GAMM|nr:SUF system Fe-S cluster assembly regulator [Kushneria phosphatilytica]OHV09958.1 SUF system Fe-S cluster assembly regulator [Kushneria phosphatilytica]QEL11637.1 SUF system Fe-S cluster assembly regulator [Kushneria phosphatilytica]